MSQVSSFPAVSTGILQVDRDPSVWIPDCGSPAVTRMPISLFNKRWYSWKVSFEKQFCCFKKKIENTEQMGVQVATGNLVICRMFSKVWDQLVCHPGKPIAKWKLNHL